MSVTVSFPNLNEIDAIKLFYKEVGYSKWAEVQDEEVFVISKNNELITGVVRLSPEHGVLTLRGMQIHKDFQRQGLGTKLIKLLETKIDQTCYCIPHNWLEGFYNQIGFKKVDKDIAPLFLQERLEENLKKHPHLIIMRRDLR